jgi:glucose dehydrogenase
MSLLTLNRTPSRNQLRLFGGVALLLAGCLAWRIWHHGHAATALGLIIGVAVLIGPGWFYLPWMRRVYLGACYATFPIGYVVSHLLLAGIYFLVMLPIGLLLRCFGRNPLDWRWRADIPSYWQDRTPPPAPDRYFDQH